MTALLSNQKQVECESKKVSHIDVEKVAKMLFEAFVKDERYGPVDKLGLAASKDSLLVALYEVERGVRSEVEEVDKSFEKVFEALAIDARKPECLEEAIRLAHVLAVKALAIGGEVRE